MCSNQSHYSSYATAVRPTMRIEIQLARVCFSLTWPDKPNVFCGLRIHGLEREIFYSLSVFFFADTTKKTGMLLHLYELCTAFRFMHDTSSQL